MLIGLFAPSKPLDKSTNVLNDTTIVKSDTTNIKTK
jgi:hypothetical protein